MAIGGALLAPEAIRGGQRGVLSQRQTSPLAPGDKPFVRKRKRTASMQSEGNFCAEKVNLRSFAPFCYFVPLAWG